MDRRQIAVALLVSVFGIFGSTACLRAAEPAASTQPGQLPRDPNNAYGQFDNGMRYIVRKNANPPGKVALYLHIDSGALNETDQQNGLAHFIEHMAFNGSEHYPAGELVPLLNRLGMTFGADTNAHTTLEETVYKLTMPDTRPETIDTALSIFLDYASGLSFGDSEIDAERKVILEETRSRKSVQQRLRRQLTKNLFAGTRLATHDVIGDEEQIKTFPRAQFLDYWNAWYRPEFMTLIVVGDINSDEIIAAAKAKLGSFKARLDPQREPLKAGIKPFAAPRVFINTDAEQVSGSITMLGLAPARPPITTYAQIRRDAAEAVSQWIVNRRFSDLVRKGGAPFRRAGIGSDDFLHEAFEVTASASGEPQDWNKMLDALIAELSRAIDHGFTQREFDLAKTEFLSGAERAIKTESTRDSTAIVRALSTAVGDELPILSAQQRYDLTKQALDELTVDDVHKIFVANYKMKEYAYVLTAPSGKEGFTLPSDDDLLAAAHAAWARKTEPLAETKLAGSILASEPDAGKVIAQQTDEDLAITDVTFANGVILHHKFSDYKKDSATISLLMPGGAIEEIAGNKGISEIAGIILSRPATSRFTSSQIRDLLTGKNVSVGGGIGFDTLSLDVSGSPADLPIGMQLAHALLTDGVLEQSALDDWKKAALQSLKAKKTSAQAQLSDAMTETFYGNDLRMTDMDEAQINRQERSPAEAWFKRIAGHAAVEVTVVGDLTLERAIELVGEYYGSLPTRAGDFAALDSLRKLQRDPGPYGKRVEFTAIAPKAVILAGYQSCDALDPERRPLSLATHILSDRMIKRLREQQQLVYSIGISNSPARTIPGTGVLATSVPTDPKNTARLIDEIFAMIKEFADDGPTDEELFTAKKQIANRLDAQMKEPSFWLGQMNDITYRRRPLSDLKQLPGIYQTFTAGQVRDAVKKYVKDDRALRYEIIPTGATTAPVSAPASAPAAAGAQ